MIALVWEAAFAADGAVAEARLGGEIVPLAAIADTLLLAPLRLHYTKYGAAAAGLVQARAANLRVLDIRGNEFECEAIERLIDAVANAPALTSINGRVIGDGGRDGVELRRALLAGCSRSVPGFCNFLFANGPGPVLASCLSRASDLPAAPSKKRGKKENVAAVGPRLDEFTWTFALARVEALEWRALDLKDQSIGEFGAAALAAGIRFLTTLQVLDLRGNRLGMKGGVLAVEGLPALPALRSLDLRDNNIGGEGWECALGAVRSCSALESLNGEAIAWYWALADGAQDRKALDVSGRALGEDGAALVCELAVRPGAGSLVSLDASGCLIGEEGGKSLARGLAVLTALRALKLGFNSLNDKGVQALAESLQSAAALEVLDLQSNDMWHSGAAVVADALLRLSSLRELHLQYNRISHTAAPALAAALGSLPALETVDLDGNNFGEDGCTTISKALIGATSLRSLDLQRNGVRQQNKLDELRGILSHLVELELTLSDGILSS
jgi:Ran GTPase-activating protein (RanGAP) involved in mRNA processing and transport